MRQLLVLGTIVLLGACSKPVSQSTAPAAATGQVQAGASSPIPAVLSAGGAGAIRFGMTLAQAEQATGGKAVLPTPFDAACSMVRFAALPKLRFMVENGVVTRADAEPGVSNALGIAVGDALDAVRATHPEGVIGPHKYDAQGHTLTFPGADGRSAILVEASGGKVTRVRAGLQPAVAYVETCG